MLKYHFDIVRKWGSILIVDKNYLVNNESSYKCDSSFLY